MWALRRHSPLACQVAGSQPSSSIQDKTAALASNTSQRPQWQATLQVASRGCPTALRKCRYQSIVWPAFVKSVRRCQFWLGFVLGDLVSGCLATKDEQQTIQRSLTWRCSLTTTMPGGISAPVITPTSELINPTTKIRLQCATSDVDIYYTVHLAAPADDIAYLIHIF